MKLKYYKALDGVRGMAALMVMFFHFFQFNIVGGNLLLNSIQKVSVFGQTGVSLFFVLSGFLITRILLQTKNHESFFWTFYIRRSFRIFPLYYLFLIISYFIIPFISGATSPELKHQWYYWLYLQNIATTFNWESAGPAHFWSLAVEEQFYLLWPLVVFFVNERNFKKLTYSLIILSVFSRALLIWNGYGTFFFTLSNIDALVIGALLAKKELDGEIEYGNYRKYWIFLILAFIPVLALWLLTGGQGMDIIQIIKLTLLAVVYFCLLRVVMTSQKGFIKSFFLSKTLQFSGKISYGLYVFHPLCFHLVSSTFPGSNLFVLMFASFAFSYLISALSFYIFELPILRLKNKFEYKELPVKESKLDNVIV